jgi:hypothetical protein
VCGSAYFFKLATVLKVQDFENRRVMLIQGLVVWIRTFIRTAHMMIMQRAARVFSHLSHDTK